MKDPHAIDWTRFFEPESSTKLSPTDECDSNHVTQLAIELPTPKPLPNGLSPVSLFDADSLLPAVLRDYVLDCSRRLQVDASFVAVPLLCSLGTVVGNRIGLRPKSKDNWVVYPNMWGGIVGRPSTLKTSSLTAGTAPLTQMETAANKQHEHDMAEWRQKFAVAKIKRDVAIAEATKAARRGSEPNGATLMQGSELVEPSCRRFTSQDATPEVLHKILTAKKNATGIMLSNDELTKLLAQMDDDARGKALRAFLLAGWNGSTPVTVDRIGRGENMRVEKCCVSVCGGIQPGKLAPLVSGALSESTEDDGWLQRFQLLVWPDDQGEYVSRDAEPDTAAFAAVMGLFERLENTTGDRYVGAERDPHTGDAYLRCTPEAAKAFDDWLVEETNDIRKCVRENSMSPAVESHFIKYRKLVAGLSLLWHLAEEADQPAVSVACVNRALAWLPYLKAHALRVYGGGNNLTLTAAKSLLARIKSKDLMAEFTAREVKRPNWSGLTDSKIVDAALELLVDHGWLTATLRFTDGRKTTDYTAHPGVFSRVDR